MAFQCLTVKVVVETRFFKRTISNEKPIDSSAVFFYSKAYEERRCGQIRIFSIGHTLAARGHERPNYMLFMYLF